jgi:protein phosphatase
MSGALVLMVGAPGSGKTTLANLWFGWEEITSLDMIRGFLTGDENNQSATGEAVALQHRIVEYRCRLGLLTCVDNTNLVPEHRAPLLQLADQHQVPTYAVVLDVEVDTALRQNRQRAEAGGRRVAEQVIRDMHASKTELVPAVGPLPGFTVTRRIGTHPQLFGDVPRQHLAAPWLR